MLHNLLLRLLFIVFVSAFAVNVYSKAVRPEDWDFPVAATYAAIAAFVAVVLVLFEWRYQRAIVRELVAVVFGLAAGLLMTVLLFAITIAFYLPSKGGDFNAAFETLQPALPLLLAGCCYVTVTVVLQTKSDFRFLIPYIDFSQHGTQEGGIVLDTSAIIDGRIADICETRIITSPILVPDFVIREVQTLADSADGGKRQRGRRGLDMVARLQKVEGARVVVRETDVPAGSPVDAELVRLAKSIHGRILTTDYNLNKVSQIGGLTVINVNDIANALKPAVLPGDALRIKILRPGQEADQGVGYLDDGTMVVVENGKHLIGRTVPLVVTGAIQTSAGRMIFSRPADEPAGDAHA